MVEILSFSILYMQFTHLKRLIWILGGIGIIYTIVETLQIDATNTSTFQSYSKIISSFIIVIMALSYILGQIKEEENIENRFLNYSIIVYFSIELILLLPLNFLINNESHSVYYVWFSHLCINLFFYIFIIRFIWKNGKTHKQLSSGL
ncbi:MAG: hypothetical protein ACI93P_001791 [bacterium]